MSSCEQCTYFRYCNRRYHVMQNDVCCEDFTADDIYHEKSKSCLNCIYNKHPDCSKRKTNDVCESWWSDICICGTKIIQPDKYHWNQNCCQECAGVRQHTNKEVKIKICAVCGQSHEREEMLPVCKHRQLLPTLIQSFGFDTKVLGSAHSQLEFDRIRNELLAAYSNGESLVTLADKYKNRSKLLYIFRSLNINTRNHSDASTNAIKQGRLSLRSSGRYIRGLHRTWDGRRVFLRSNYEFDFAEQLDREKVQYEVEFLRILYFDTQRRRKRIAIPDFYLSDENLIIEVKPADYYDAINIEDRFRAYKEQGYRCFLELI